ncbi:MAG: hypothetical protein B7Z14_08610 [Bosea sp. 32-68-6]|nr:MAG: hypothetical protein B7Z14_08610 [Bosea sp. 32-68-6]
MAGQIERGRAILATLEPQEPHLPWTEFGLFVIEYLADDLEKAAGHANLMPGKRYPPGLLARALIASRKGDTVAAADMMTRLQDISPQWRTEPSRQLAKYFPDPAVHDRILSDLRPFFQECVNPRSADRSPVLTGDEPC